jgi:hypothetical protein
VNDRDEAMSPCSIPDETIFKSLVVFSWWSDASVTVTSSCTLPAPPAPVVPLTYLTSGSENSARPSVSGAV